jgi:hypothetical protein
MCGELVLYFSTGSLLYFCSVLHFPHCFMAVCFSGLIYVSLLLQAFILLLLFLPLSLFTDYSEVCSAFMDIFLFGISFPCVL